MIIHDTWRRRDFHRALIAIAGAQNISPGAHLYVVRCGDEVTKFGRGVDVLGRLTALQVEPYPWLPWLELIALYRYTSIEDAKAVDGEVLRALAAHRMGPTDHFRCAPPEIRAAIEYAERLWDVERVTDYGGRFEPLRNWKLSCVTSSASSRATHLP